MDDAAPPLVDAHAHIWSADMPYVPSAWTRPDYAYPVERYLADLDANGVRYGVIAAASLFGTHADYTLAALRTHPRLRGTVIVDPAIPAAELGAMRDAGVVGIRLQWFFLNPLPDLRAEPYRTLLSRLRDLDMHIHINVEGARLPELLAAAGPSGVRVVVDHFGWATPHLDPEGAGEAALLRAAGDGRCWVKLSAGFRYPDPATPRALAERLIRQAGTDRLFWGSDAPFVGREETTTYADTIRFYRQSVVPDAEARRAIDRTAFRFYFG